MFIISCIHSEWTVCCFFLIVPSAPEIYTYLPPLSLRAARPILRTGKLRVHTGQRDRSAGAVTWSGDGKTIYTAADHIGNVALFAIDVATGAAKALVEIGRAHV